MIGADDPLAGILTLYRVTMHVEDHITDMDGHYRTAYGYTAVVIAESDTTKFTGTAWGKEREEAVNGAVDRVYEQVLLLANWKNKGSPSLQ